MDDATENEIESSNLMKHAVYELQRINEDSDTIANYLKVIKAFLEAGHSGSSGAIAIWTIHQLLQFKPLTNLTDDPDEWYFHAYDDKPGSSGIYQNKRDGEAFSYDGGKTYYLVDNPLEYFESEPVKK